MENEFKSGDSDGKKKSGGTGVKREVSFAEPEKTWRGGEEERCGSSGDGAEEDEGRPQPPPRKNRKRRLSKSRRGVAFAPTTEEEDRESDSEAFPPSRLPELLRRDTFCDTLDFKLYSLKRLPGRRASSLDGLYWEDEEWSGGEAEGTGTEGEGLSSWRSLEEVGRLEGIEGLKARRKDWLEGLLDLPGTSSPPPSSPSISSSLREFESSILDMLTNQHIDRPPTPNEPPPPPPPPTDPQQT